VPFNCGIHGNYFHRRLTRTTIKVFVQLLDAEVVVKSDNHEGVVGGIVHKEVKVALRGRACELGRVAWEIFDNCERPRWVRTDSDLVKHRPDAKIRNMTIV
jgi:hypothetical protein